MNQDGIILLNMGGPDNLNEVKLFLTNMFDDPNILTVKNLFLRKLIAKLIVISRVKASKEIYKTLGGKSPIVDITKTIVDKLQHLVGDKCVVDFAMRYTPPFADEVVKRLKEKNISKIYLIPMYPHYSTTTTKSSVDDFMRALKECNFKADVITIDKYYDNTLYNEAIIKRIDEKMSGENYKDYDLIFSAHGLPQKIIDAGDKYQHHIQENVEILKQMLVNHGINFAKIHLAYQSKLGPLKWLEPSLEQKLNVTKTKNVVIFPIAFTVDNSETDFELAIEYKKIAQEIGIKNYRVCRCVDEHPLFIDALQELYEQLKRND